MYIFTLFSDLGVIKTTIGKLFCAISKDIKQEIVTIMTF